MSIEVFMGHVGAALTGILANPGWNRVALHSLGLDDAVAIRAGGKLAVLYAIETYKAGYLAYNAGSSTWKDALPQPSTCPSCLQRTLFPMTGGKQCASCGYQIPEAVPGTPPTPRPGEVAASLQAEGLDRANAAKDRPASPTEGRVSITKEKHRKAILMLDRIKVAVQATWAGHGTVSDINEMANSAIENLKGGAKDL